MKSPMLRFLFVATLLFLLGVVACKEHAQDICLGIPQGEDCSIDRGCDPPDPGHCEPMGQNNIMTCIPY